MRIDIITLFPEMFEPVLNGSIIGRAQKSGVLEIVCHQLRDYAFDKHKRVDDTPYGGGMGMLMKAEPIALCFEDICKQIGKRPHFVYMSPQGKTLKQQRLRELADIEISVFSAVITRVLTKDFLTSLLTKKFQSATMFSRAEKFPQWYLLMHFQEWFRVCFPTTNVLPRKAILTDSLSIRSTQNRQSGEAKKFPKCL